MILVAHPQQPFDMTAKMQPRRKVVLEMYQMEIDAAYNALDDSSVLEAAP